MALIFLDRVDLMINSLSVSNSESTICSHWFIKIDRFYARLRLGLGLLPACDIISLEYAPSTKGYSISNAFIKDIKSSVHPYFMRSVRVFLNSLRVSYSSLIYVISQVNLYEFKFIINSIFAKSYRSDQIWLNKF